jgi:hypothetical protein
MKRDDQLVNVKSAKWNLVQPRVYGQCARCGLHTGQGVKTSRSVAFDPDCLKVKSCITPIGNYHETSEQQGYVIRKRNSNNQQNFNQITIFHQSISCVYTPSKLTGNEIF